MRRMNLLVGLTAIATLAACSAPTGNSGIIEPDVVTVDDAVTQPDVPAGQDVVSTPDVPMAQDVVTAPDVPVAQDVVTAPDVPVAQDVVSTPDVLVAQDVVDVPPPPVDVLPTCTGTDVLCAGRCADLRSDRANCGACGRACAAGLLCVDRTCIIECSAGLTPCADACRDLQTDRAHCGACGRACATGQQCMAGACRTVCPSGQVACGDRCSDLQTDPLNCGACGTMCGNGQSCMAGVCRGTICTPPLTVCGMSCVDTRYDPDHCGRCGAACPPYPNMTRACGSGACVPGVCVTGFADCNAMQVDGCEVSTASDPNNCGGCGRACTTLPNASATCAGGSCGIGACNAGYANCDGNATNGCETALQSDRMNCGACGTVCPGVCRDGVCSDSLHNTAPWTGTLTLSTGCQYNDTHRYTYMNAGNLTFRECLRAASRVGAMLAVSQYTIPNVGWCGHRHGSMAMTGRWPTYQEASIDAPQACVIGRDHRTTARDAVPSDTVIYDGQTWRFQDYGPRYYDECQLLAAQAGASMITPTTVGRTTSENYWVQSQHTYNTYSWVIAGGTTLGHNDVGCGARSSIQRCMVGYVEN